MRMHTQDAAVQLAGLSDAQRSLRQVLADKLTETQYRRVTLLYGLDGGEAMSLRQAGRAESVTQQAVHQSRDLAWQKMAGDWRLWGMWLLLDSEDIGEDGGAASNWEHVYTNGSVSKPEMAELSARFAGYGDQPWDSDGSEGRTAGHVPAVMTEQEAYADGWLAFRDGERQNPYEDDGSRAEWERGWNEAAGLSAS